MTMAGGSSIRPANSDDAAFIACIVLAAQRGPLPRGWCDIALARSEPECLAFMARLAIARARSWYHVAHFLIAEVDGVPAAALCALPAAGTL
ncbi:GNAT family N-acetyltransferase, partial [Bradyrhizobium sp. Arg68]|nr:GNAT family N-acetyltransferase [Bradyrhizobium ivorense]